MRNLNYGTNELIYETETDSQTQRTDLGLPKGGDGGEMDRKFGISRCKLSYTGCINNMVYCIAQGHSISCNKPQWKRIFYTHTHTHTGFPGQESACNAGDLCSIPGWGRSPGGGHGNPLQYSFPGNPMDRGAWEGYRSMGLQNMTYRLNNKTTFEMVV